MRGTPAALRDPVQVRHYSPGAATTCVAWARRFLRFHDGRDVRRLSAPLPR